MNIPQLENEVILNSETATPNEDQQWWMSRAFIVSQWVRMNLHLQGTGDNNEDVWLIKDDQIATIPEMSASSSDDPIDENKFKWFECGLQMGETKQELDEHEIAVKEQIKMGIIQVQQPPSFNVGNMGGIQISGPQQINNPTPSFNIAKTPGGPQIGNNMSAVSQNLPNPFGMSKAMALSLGLVPNQQRIQPNTKIGRNDKCPCGSGKKFKVCCGRGN